MIGLSRASAGIQSGVPSPRKLGTSSEFTFQIKRILHLQLLCFLFLDLDLLTQDFLTLDLVRIDLDLDRDLLVFDLDLLSLD